MHANIGLRTCRSIALLLALGTGQPAHATLLLHYAFDGDYSDRGSLNSKGTPTNGVSLTTAATNVWVGTGTATFDGADFSYVVLSNAITFANGVPWSAAFWAQRTGGANQGMVMGDPSNNSDFIWLTDNFNGFRFRSSTIASNNSTADFTAAKDLKRHHYALVASGNGTMSLYIDGVFAQSLSVANTGIKIAAIGKAYTNAGYTFKGLLDDVRVYNTVLDANAVSDLYRLGSPVRYEFDNGLADSGPSTNTATACGNALVVTSPLSVLSGTGALLLDGEDVSYLALSNALAFSAADAWTAAFWARRAADDDHGMVAGRRGTSSDFIWLNASLSGLRFCSSAGMTLDLAAPKDTIPHCYALVAAGGGALSLYVDGVLTTNVSGADTSFVVDTIGQAYPPALAHLAFKGVLDDVYLSPGALDAASLSVMYKRGPVLALHYAFDGNLTDSGAYAAPGIASGNAVVTNSPAVALTGSGALLLDGDDRSNIRLSTPITFANGVPWSAVFWAKRDETGGQKGMIMGKNQTTTDFIWLNDSYRGLRFRTTSNVTYDFVAPKDLIPHHYALVSEGNATLSFYVDGALVSNVAAAATSFAIDTVGQAYTTNTSHFGFQGVLDDVRVYTYAVTAATVAALTQCSNFARLHYAFDADFTDSSAAGNNGTPSGTASLTTSTNSVRVGSGALTLDGADSSYVALATPISFANGSPWSIAFWARRGETGGQKGMVLGEAATYANFIWLNDNFTGLRFRSAASNTVDFTTPKDLNSHHYALVATGSGLLSLYLDGALLQTQSLATNSFLINAIGQAYTTSAHYGFKGSLDDVCVYASALSAQGVAGLYQQGSAAPVAPPAATTTVTRVHVILQGGQSNSEGRADPAELPLALQGYQGDVDFYYLNTLSTLYPATSTGTQFGPEITCGRRFVDLEQPGASTRVAIVKYSVGGTSLYNDWKAGGDATPTGDGPRYVAFQSMVTSGLAALAAAYPSATITLAGMIWMQGESDVNSNAAAYYANLKTFIADVRLTYGRPRLPFVVGRLSASQTGAGSVSYLNQVRQAQTLVADEDPFTGLVNTDGFSLKPDNLHFNAAGQQSLGMAFAEQLVTLLHPKGTVLQLN